MVLMMLVITFALEKPRHIYNMRKTFIYLILISLVLFSCKRGKKELILGKWHAVKLENPSMDSFFANSQAYIDTIGKNNDPATNMSLYGATNMDSMRHLLQQQFDSAKFMQLNAVMNTMFNFRKDSIVLLSFNGSLDSSKWYFNTKNENELILAQLNTEKGAAPNDNVTMKVLALSDTVLKLRFEENGSASTVTFNRNEK
jgi:hypothetical protein